MWTSEGHIERFFASVIWVGRRLLMGLGIFRQILTSRYAPFGKLPVAGVKGPCWLFQRFEVKSRPHHLGAIQLLGLWPKRQSWPKVRLVAISR